MKLAVVVLLCMAAVAVQSTSEHKDVKIADKAFLEKEKFFLQILLKVEDPLLFEEWIQHGEKLVVDKSHYTVYEDSMNKFYESYKIGGLLAHDDFFSVVSKYHVRQASGLFNFFYYAKEWNTFVDNVVWARINVNPGMFVYALTLAVTHRSDMNGIILPTIYEIFPQMFFHSKLVMEAEKFDWTVFNKQIMYEKQWASVYEKKHVKNIHSKYWYMKDWKMWQWWKLMGLDEEWHLEEKCVLRDNVEILMNDSKWTALWNDMNMVWMPVDYTRDIEIFNDETKLSYFTEDLGWNAYWYYLNMDNARVLKSKQFNLDKNRRGEWWLFNVQQMMARYFMERLSHNFGDISEISWHHNIIPGYDSELVAYNGVPFSSRKNYWEVQSHENVELLNKIMSIDRRIDDAIATGKFLTKTGVSIDLWNPKSVEHIGNLMQGNMDIIDKVFFGYWLPMASMYFSGQEYHEMNIVPSVFLNYETMMRDPLYYHLLKRVVEVMKNFKKVLPSYTHEELLVEGVTITDVHVDKMKTYFDLMDFDVTNLLNDDLVFENGKFVWNKTLLARQMRLNHMPYNLEIKVTAEKPQKVLVRTFLAPDFDQFGQKINLIKHYENIMELDEFTYTLVEGENVIKRSSNDYDWTIKDRTTYSELYHMIMMAYEGKQEFALNTMESYCGFPARLVLPHGWVSGMPMKMFFMISAFDDKHEQLSTDNDTYMCGVHHFDELSFGYPFDRMIESITDFFVPNMFWKDVKIYHVDKFEKYYDHKYEHFGTFDYNFI